MEKYWADVLFLFVLNLKAKTQKNFDNQTLGVTGTMNRFMPAISGHWTEVKAGHVYAHSAVINSTIIQPINT